MASRLSRQTRCIANAYTATGLYSVPLLTLVTVISMTNVFTSGYFSRYPGIGGLWAFIFAATIDVNIVRLFLESHCERVKGNVSASRMAFWVALGLAIVTGAALLVEGLQQSIGVQWTDGTVKGFIGVLIAARVILVVVLMAREGCKLGAALVQNEPVAVPFTQELKPPQAPLHQMPMKHDEEQSPAEEKPTLQIREGVKEQEERVSDEQVSCRPIHLKAVAASRDKHTFVREYLTLHPDASISTIVKAASLKGISLSTGYVSQQRKQIVVKEQTA